MVYIKDDPNFFRETVFQIKIWDDLQADTDTDPPYYEFDPWDYSTTKNYPTFASLSRSMVHHGIMELQLEDDGYIINTDRLRTPAKFECYQGKQDGEMRKYLFGILRGFGHSAGYKGKILYNLAGYGWGIRMSERIIDFDRNAPVKNLNGIELDQSAVNSRANEILKDGVGNQFEYPNDVDDGQTESTAGYNWIHSNNLDTSSNIQDFIASVVLRFGTIQDLANLVEQTTGGRVFVDFDRDVQLLSRPFSYSNNHGFVFKDLINRDIDDPDTTAYLTSGLVEYGYSMLVDNGYSNHIYGILPADNDPPVDTWDSYTSYTNNKDFEIAVPFRPPTNPNWMLWIGAQLNDGDADNNVPRSRWRIANDANPLGVLPSTIVNVGGIVNSYYGYQGGYDLDQSKTEAIFITKNRGGLDSRKWYWLILSSVNADATNYWRWARTSSTTATRATAPINTSTSTDGGSGWTYNTAANLMAFFFGRSKAQPMSIINDKSIRKNMVIDSAVDLPIHVKERFGATVYMLGVARFRTRPRPVFENVTIRPPNKNIFEGDIATIRHSDLRFGTVKGSRAVLAQIGDVNYTYGVRNGGGEDPAQIGLKKLSLTLLGYPTIH